MSSRASEPAWRQRSELRVLNTDIPRLDGPEKVTGRALYTHDVRLADMVFARLLVHPYPRARIARLDVAPALDVPGVVHAAAVKPDGEPVRYQGADAVLAVVAATTPEAAEDGLRAIVVEAEDLWPPIVTREQALAPDAPEIGRNGNVGSSDTRGDRGAAEAALERADAVVEARYSVPVQHHVCLETHGVVVDYRGGKEATLYCSTQAVSATHGSFARALGLPASAVRVVTEHMGGGFGSKFGLGFEGEVACRVAKALGRPVHLMLTRPDEFLMAGNRSGSVQRMKGGATADGRFLALVVDADRLGGQNDGSLPMPPYIYSVEHAFADVRSVYTATDPNRAMRAPGHPQASFAMESMVDELAYAIGMDPLEFRRRNLGDEVWHRQLDRVAKEIGWEEHPHKTAPDPARGGRNVGIGFGVSVWGSRSREGTVREVRILADGGISASTCTQDLGTGSRTLVAAIVAEEFGLSPEDVTARIGDSTLPPSVGSGGSTTTGSLAPAVKDAAHRAREAFAERLADVLEARPDEIVWREGRVEAPGGASLVWREACAALGASPLVARGEWREHLKGEGVHGAQAAKVEVDTLTGELRVLRMVCIQDQGLVLNRLALRSQINGGMVQALSYGLLEERVIDPDLGLMLNGNLEDYKIAGCQEMPEMTAIPDDDDTRLQVMGMAEAPVIPGHGAIANALFNACGVRLRDLPLTADRVLTGLMERS